MASVAADVDLALQARPTSTRGKGLVNCVYKPCPIGMQLAG